MTIFGLHTAAEVKDLLAAKDYDIAQVQAAFDRFQPAWNDSPAWETDWNAFLARYQKAHTEATVAMAVPHPGVRDAAFPLEGIYQDILKALTATPGHFTDTDFQGLHNRLVAAMGKPIDFKDQPLPTSPDADLNVLNETQKFDLIASAKKNPKTWGFAALLVVLGVGTVYTISK